MNAAHLGRPLPDATRVGDAAPAPRASWLQQGDAWVLTLDGEWRDTRSKVPFKTHFVELLSGQLGQACPAF